MEAFAVDPRLANDCHLLGHLPSGWLLLNRKAAVTWFILVPETACDEPFDLPEPQAQALWRDAGRLGAWLRRSGDCHKVNLAAIGNLVGQLHVHIVGRRRDDPAWPGVVWGHPLDDRRYTPEQLAGLIAQLSDERSLGLSPANPDGHANP